MSIGTIDILVRATDRISIDRDGWVVVERKGKPMLRIMTTLGSANALSEVFMIRANALDEAAQCRELKAAAEKHARANA